MAHRLLLADDSVTIQRVIKLTFADEDVDVVAVSDGDQAVASIDQQPPDIVLADVAMPGRTGYDVAEHIRSSPRLAHIPVLLLTGAFEPVDDARATALGCDGVLEKPFEPGAVVSRVTELLTRPRRTTREAAPAPPQSAASALDPPVESSRLPAATAAFAAPRPSTDVDAYFERLDQAFASLASTPRPVTPAAEAPGVEQEPLPVAPLPELSRVGVPAPATSGSGGGSEVVALSDAQVQQIVDRVIDALTARLGVPLAEVVATIAERAVREEIAEIKRRV